MNDTCLYTKDNRVMQFFIFSLFQIAQFKNKNKNLLGTEGPEYFKY